MELLTGAEARITNAGGTRAVVCVNGGTGKEVPGTWAPTLELSAHIRALPVTGWLRVRVSTRNFAGGLLEEDAEVWDSADRLVAQSRQLARAPQR